MQNILQPLFPGYFSNPSTLDTNTNALSGISSYGALNTDGFLDATFAYSEGRKAVCVSGIVNFPVVANNVDVLYKGPENNYELTEFITNFLRRGSDTFSTSIGGPREVSGPFSIYSKLCIPTDRENTTKPTSVQFLSHGGTLDNTYWDFAPDYSYVDAAAEKGYATFSYDRLGTGRSTRADPLKIVQMPLQVELAHVIIQNLKRGAIAGVAFDQVVGIGHSLGAGLTQGVAGKYSDDFDALVLTGHSGFHGGSGTGFSAAAQQIANTVPDHSDLKTCQMVFKKNFETRQSNAIGETLTLGSTYVPTNFTKPVQILNGQQDFFYCQGNCLAEEGDVTADSLALFYPARDVEKSQAITVPNIGHNINFHYGRLEVFGAMLEFILECGIKP